VFCLADASRDNWNRVPSAGARPYEYSCTALNLEGPGCDNSSHWLHDRHVADVILLASSMGYDTANSVWWGYSEGGAMVSAHLNYLLQRNASGSQPQDEEAEEEEARLLQAGKPLHAPKAMVLESTGGQYCYAFRPTQEAQLKSTAYWDECESWSNNNCCPKLLTEQFYYEHAEQYPSHPPVLLVGGVETALPLFLLQFSRPIYQDKLSTDESATEKGALLIFAVRRG
jgi:hypothetical protein